MNMKKLFLLFALMGMVAIGCTKDEVDKDDDNENKTEQPNDNEGGNKDDFPESIFFGLDKESVTISPDGGSVDVVVYSITQTAARSSISKVFSFKLPAATPSKSSTKSLLIRSMTLSVSGSPMRTLYSITIGSPFTLINPKKMKPL